MLFNQISIQPINVTQIETLYQTTSNFKPILRCNSSRISKNITFQQNSKSNKPVEVSFIPQQTSFPTPLHDINTVIPFHHRAKRWIRLATSIIIIESANYDVPVHGPGHRGSMQPGLFCWFNETFRSCANCPTMFDRRHFRGFARQRYLIDAIHSQFFLSLSLHHHHRFSLKTEREGGETKKRYG